jgi:hypothetical protein
MNTVIVYVDDAAHARQILEPLAARAAATSTCWVLVACAPRMTHRISKWVNNSARENWRAKWAEKLFTQLQPWLDTTGAQVSTLLAKGPLPEVVEKLQALHGANAAILDARRPKQEHMPEQAPAPAPAAAAPTVTRKPPRRWSGPGSLASLGLLLMLVED